MAITITQNPEFITPSDNPVTWVFESTQTSQPNFYFIIEVQIASPSVYSVVERHKIFPEVGNVAHFDASSITERYATLFNPDIVKIKLTITENWDNAVLPDTVTTGDRGVFKARLRKKDFILYRQSDYALLNAPNIKYRTFEPMGTAKVRDTEIKYLNFVNAHSAVCNAEYRTYTEAGVLIDTKTEVLSNDYWQSVSVGIFRLTNSLSLNFVNASYYTIDIDNGAFGGRMELYTIQVDKSCVFSTATRLHFINTLGVIDSFTFGLIARQSFDVKSYGYERQFGNFNGNQVFTYDLRDGTILDYIKTSRKKIELTSDWIPENVQNWLSKELYMSPMVWIEEELDLYRCKVTNTSFDQKIQENDVLFQEVAQIELESNISVNV